MPVAHKEEVTFTLSEKFETTNQVPSLDIVSSLSDLFDDPKLSYIMAEALEHNLDIQSARRNLEASGYNISAYKASFYPDLNLSTNATRTRDFATYQNTFGFSLDTNWELDVWGKIDDQVKAASYANLGQAEQVSYTQQSIAAQVAQAYFAVISSIRIADIYEHEYQSFKQTEQTIKEQFALGLSDGDDFDSASASSYNALQNLEQAKRDARDAKRMLNALMAKYPDTEVDVSSNYPALDKTIPSGLPSTLLLSRPDIKVAYFKVAEADTNAVVAYKDMLPSFSLTSSFGRRSDELADITNGSLSVWSLAFNLASPLFDAGLRKARLGQNSALADAAYADYQQVVLEALLEVEQALDAEYNLYSQQKIAEKAYNFAQSAEQRATQNYASGLVSIFDLLEVRRNRFSAERIIETLRLERYQNRVALALALGKAY